MENDWAINMTILFMHVENFQGITVMYYFKTFM